MADLLLDPLTGDLDISDNTLHITEEGSESIAQRLKIRLRFFFQEWILDRSQGTRWFEVVLRKDVEKFAADAEIRRVVLETPEIKTIENWNSTIDSRTRQYEVRFDVKSIEGETLSFGFQDLLN